MKLFTLTALVLSAGTADELAAERLKGLQLNVPAAWEKRDNQGSTRYVAPSGEAFFDVDVGLVQRVGGMPAAECLDKILAGIGPAGFRKTSIGGQPAAYKMDTDTDEEGKEFLSYTYVGCDGRTTWSIMFNMIATKKERFQPLSEKVCRSVVYMKADK